MTTTVHNKKISNNNIFSQVNLTNNHNKTTNYHQIIQDKINELSDKLESGDTETTYAIGAQSFTEREWDKLMTDFDKAQDSMRVLMRERHKEMEETKDK